MRECYRVRNQQEWIWLQKKLGGKAVGEIFTVLPSENILVTENIDCISIVKIDKSSLFDDVIEVSNLMEKEGNEMNKIKLTPAEKAEFDELRGYTITLHAALGDIGRISFPNLYKKICCGSVEEDKAQIEFACMWADPSTIEVIPEKKWHVRVPAVENPTYYYKTGDGVDVCKPSPTMQDLKTVQFTAEELKHYGLDGDWFEKIEVREQK